MITAADAAKATEDLPGLPTDGVAGPAVMVIFGGTGDLAHRKLLPALYHLAARGSLPPQFAVVGIGRSVESDAGYQEAVSEAVRKFVGGNVSDHVLDSFTRAVFFCQGSFQDPALYDCLKSELARIHQDSGTQGNTLFYLATPPEFDAPIVEQLDAAGLITPAGCETPWTRVIFEKPFGWDLSSATELNRSIHSHLKEDQIFRIDHYLGKEAVQNIMAVRFANAVLEPLWNRNYVDSISITAAESVGVENRAGYYEQAGALRDMVQSHLLQVLSLVAMEPPVSWSAKAIHDEKVKVLQAIARIRGVDVDRFAVRGQYGPGVVDGAPVPGYRQEPGVDPETSTETFAALRLTIDSWRWAGVPIYLRTGKRLPSRVTEVILTFKKAPQMLFQEASASIEEDVLRLRIQPDEGVTLTLNSKVPGRRFQIKPIHLDFLYGSAYMGTLPDAYERLLLDALCGNSTLFTRTDEVEEGWAIVQGILDYWSLRHPDFPDYPAGTWGPEAAERLLDEGHVWRRPGQLGQAPSRAGFQP